MEYKKVSIPPQYPIVNQDFHYHKAKEALKANDGKAFTYHFSAWGFLKYASMLGLEGPHMEDPETRLPVPIEEYLQPGILNGRFIMRHFRKETPTDEDDVSTS